MTIGMQALAESMNEFKKYIETRGVRVLNPGIALDAAPQGGHIGGTAGALCSDMRRVQMSWAPLHCPVPGLAQVCA